MSLPGRARDPSLTPRRPRIFSLLRTERDGFSKVLAVPAIPEGIQSGVLGLAAFILVIFLVVIGVFVKLMRDMLPLLRPHPKTDADTVERPGDKFAEKALAGILQASSGTDREIIQELQGLRREFVAHGANFSFLCGKIVEQGKVVNEIAEQQELLHALKLVEQGPRSDTGVHRVQAMLEAHAAKEKQKRQDEAEIARRRERDMRAGLDPDRMVRDTDADITPIEAPHARARPR